MSVATLLLWQVEICRVALLAFLVLAFASLHQTQGAQLKFEPYVLEILDKQKIAAEFALLLVSERHSKPGGKQIELALVRTKARMNHPGQPIVHLAGGPGGSGIALERGPRSPVILGLREVFDVIALDQRGTGLAKPD